jgi:hypothetical protein
MAAMTSAKRVAGAQAAAGVEGAPGGVGVADIAAEQARHPQQAHHLVGGRVL